jgi:hypothetical protein
VDSSKLRNGFVYLLILVAIVAILWSYRSQSPEPDELAISELAAAVKQERVEEISVNDDGRQLTVVFNDDRTAISMKEPSATLEEILAAYGVEPAQLGSVKIRIEESSDWSGITPCSAGSCRRCSSQGSFSSCCDRLREATTRRSRSERAGRECSAVISPR